LIQLFGARAQRKSLLGKGGGSVFLETEEQGPELKRNISGNAEQEDRNMGGK
jgi:hypothetical protein